MRLRFAVERLRDVWQEVDRIGRQHWSETEGYHAGQAYNPDLKRYFSVDDNGWFFVVTARPLKTCLMTAPMVGYAGIYCMPSMHSQAMIASEDFFFLENSYRQGWNAIRFLKFVEAECLRRGAVEISWTDKKGKGKLLEFLGYAKVATQWSKQSSPNPQVEVKGGADSTHAKANAVEAVDVYTESASTT